MLNFAENNDNNPEPVKEEKSSTEPNNPSSLCYDDGHYCSILLYCISRFTCNPLSPHANHFLQRIIDVSKYYLHRESILTAAQLYEEEGNAGTGINKARGFYKPGEELIQKRIGMSSIVGRGLVTAMALQSLCNAEIQLDTSVSRFSTATSIQCFNFRSYITSHPEIKSKSDFVSDLPTTPPFSELVRASALDCCLRLAFAKQIARLLNQSSEATSPTPKGDESRNPSFETGPSNGKKHASLSDVINLTLSVIQHDPSREVRRCAALSLLFALQVSSFL